MFFVISQPEARILKLESLKICKQDWETLRARRNLSQNKTKSSERKHFFSREYDQSIMCQWFAELKNIYNYFFLYKLCQTWHIPYIQTQNLLSYNMESWRPSDCINELHCRRISWSWRTFFGKMSWRTWFLCSGGSKLICSGVRLITCWSNQCLLHLCRYLPK